MAANSYNANLADELEGALVNSNGNDFLIDASFVRELIVALRGTNGPSSPLKMPSNSEILLVAGEMKPSELAAVKAVLRWFVSKHNATQQPLAKELSKWATIPQRAKRLRSGPILAEYGHG